MRLGDDGRNRTIRVDLGAQYERPVQDGDPPRIIAEALGVEARKWSDTSTTSPCFQVRRRVA